MVSIDIRKALSHDKAFFRSTLWFGVANPDEEALVKKQIEEYEKLGDTKKRYKNTFLM